MDISQLKQGVVIRGPSLPEPIEVLVVTMLGDKVKIQGAGKRTNQMHQRVLPPSQVADLEAAPEKEPAIEGLVKRRNLTAVATPSYATSNFRDPIAENSRSWRRRHAQDLRPGIPMPAGARNRRPCIASCASTCARSTRPWSMASRAQPCPPSCAPTSRATSLAGPSTAVSPTCSARTVSGPSSWRSRAAAAGSVRRASAAECAKER
jgi:hypothetical protein